jgi:NADH:ubiquinone oxidoreductase subunit 5 (subunit L)/multisubunit Na+/H+ antiporter MnhA subunit
MWVPLAVLAVLAVVGGFVGISTAFTGGRHVGGKLNIVNWLQPVIWNPATGRFGEAHAATGAEHGAAVVSAEDRGLLASSEPTAATQKTESEAGHGDNALPYGDTGFNLAHAAEQALGSHTAAEWLFIIISLAVAALGIGLGVLFYVKQPRLPEAWAARLGPLYRASFNKYWVDELYGALVTRRTMDAARGVYNFDSKVVDGAVNGTAWLTRRLSSLTGNADRIVVDGAVNGVAGFVKILMSPLIRAAQTGLTPNYALVMVLGLVASVAFFFWRDIWAAFGG